LLLLLLLLLKDVERIIDRVGEEFEEDENGFCEEFCFLDLGGVKIFLLTLRLSL
jgi:hypothetical protein